MTAFRINSPATTGYGSVSIATPLQIQLKATYIDLNITQPNMPKFNPPEAMPFDAPSQWPEWRERFCRYRIATRLHKDDGDIQVSSLIYAMGRQAENIFKSFRFESREPSDIDPAPADPSSSSS